MAMRQMSSVFASSSKSPSSVAPWKRYEVFLSFRGEDTRKNFTAHLYDALCRKKVQTFMDNNELENGDEISLTLTKAIEESNMSIVIFSENYASSKWCLNELIKILECKKDYGQIVIPVFYNIDPTHVRKQTGSYQQAFAIHEQDFMLNKDKLQKWKATLTEAANLVGYDSQNYRTKSDLIKDIIKVVLTNLNLRLPLELMGVVGIEKNLEQIESLLNIGSNDVKILGIWGMGGIGKTTLACALVAKHHFQFEGCCFLPNVREQSDKFGGVDALRNKLFSDLLEEENVYLAGVSNTETRFLRERLRRKKVLIVLDDVATSEQIQHLMINYNCLGVGSRVIVTSRDMHIFRQLRVCKVYEVKELNEHDSLQLFCLSAFMEKHPKIGYEDLSTKAIAYCKGHPLALKFLGARLRSRSTEAWKSELNRLQKNPDLKLHNVLKLSYDDLDQSAKEIFLDTACFFKGWHRDRVTSVLEACGFFPAIGVAVLLEKSLIQINETHLTTDMHDLMQEMGREIVNQESRDPGRRSRLWKPQEVYDVLKNNEGTEAVEGITFDTAKVGRLYLSPDSFKGMTKLRYLHIHSSESSSFSNVYIPDGLGWLSDKLRYLHWQAFNFESLPPAFCAEMLVVLSMPYSKLKKLWDGVQDLVHLKEICLDFSKYLIEVPNLSRAPNLERVSLRYCESLGQLHPSFLTLHKLTNLDLGGSKKMLKKLTQ